MQSFDKMRLRYEMYAEHLDSLKNISSINYLVLRSQLLLNL
jgi:hypothetical protein